MKLCWIVSSISFLHCYWPSDANVLWVVLFKEVRRWVSFESTCFCLIIPNYFGKLSSFYLRTETISFWRTVCFELLSSLWSIIKHFDYQFPNNQIAYLYFKEYSFSIITLVQMIDIFSASLLNFPSPESTIVSLGVLAFDKVIAHLNYLYQI